jgi:hypothetical protein
MTVAEVVTTWSTDTEPARAVVVMPAAEVMTNRLSGAVPWEEGAADAGSRLLLDAVPTGREREALSALAARLGAEDVAVLLVRQPPEDLSLGLLVTALTELELRVLQAERGDTGLGRTVVVVSRAGDLPQRGYLLGSPLDDTDAARRRKENEWALESLQLRAATATAVSRAEGAAAEVLALRTQLEAAQRKLAAARGELLDEREANRSRWERLRTRASGDARKASELLKENPAVGVARITRSATRRLKG